MTSRANTEFRNKRRLQEQEEEAFRRRKRLQNAPQPVTALQLLHQSLAENRSCLHLMHFAASGTPVLPPPSWLRLVPGRITELVGPAGSGKSQIALSLCLQTARSSQSKSLYLSLKGSSAMTKMLQRLQQMAGEEDNSNNVLTRVLTRCVVQTDDFWALLHTELPALLQQATANTGSKGRIQVVILDSLADLLRGHTDMAARSAWLLVAASQLRKLASRYNVVMVVLNQVSFGEQTPALGLTWKHCVCESFCLSRQGNTRSVSLLKSSTNQCGQRVNFEIGMGGVTLVNEGNTSSD